MLMDDSLIMIMMMETSFFKRKREMCSEVSEGISHAENYVRIQHQRLLWVTAPAMELYAMSSAAAEELLSCLNSGATC